MSPHMRLTNSILCLALAMHCWAEDNTLNNPVGSSADNPVISLSVINENPEVSRHLNLGLQCCLLNYQEKARYHFAQSLAADDSCLMAHVGMLMVYPSGSPEYKAHLKSVNSLMDSAILTPVEEWYLSTFLQYIAGDLQGAAAAFRQRAEVYRRDSMAACWDILLNHYAAEQGGNIVARADSLVQNQPENPFAHFSRALLDEYSSTPSPEALQAAQKASELLPGNPLPHQLYGHLLRRSGRLDEAISQYRIAQQSSMDDLASISLPDAATYRIASLSEVSAYWQAGKKIEALRRSLALTKQVQNGAGEGDILMHWEARTLPLRLLVLQPTPPAGAAINAAAKASNAPDGTPVKLVQDCLVAAIQTRSLADSGRLSTATQTLLKAEKTFSELQQIADDMKRAGGLKFTCFNRSTQACYGAILRARIALYADSKDLWQTYLDELLAKLEPRLLPPILPRFNQK